MVIRKELLPDGATADITIGFLYILYGIAIKKQENRSVKEKSFFIQWFLLKINMEKRL